MRTLAEWLDYQQRVHARGVDLGLERVRSVWQRLGAPPPAPLVITVGGTNGKGSTVAFLEAMLVADGKRVGCYTSPHLLRYNERVRIAGNAVADPQLVAAFERIEAVRGAISLTYFEFGTLAALLIFAQSSLDLAVLEVGLGGRLDAVNIIDADAAIVTTVDLDHQDWLGNNREAIAREKAGIFRAGRPAIIGEAAPPASLIAEAQRIGAALLRAGVEFHAEPAPAGWRWRSADENLELPEPGLAAACQRANAAAAIAALAALRARIGWNPSALAAGVRRARAAARLQRWSGAFELIADVAHNPQAARVLAQWLGAHPPAGRTFAVFGALADKDVAGIVAPLRQLIAAWHLGGLAAETPRGLSAQALHERLDERLDPNACTQHSDIGTALDASAAATRPGDRVVAFGSFYVAATTLAWAARRHLIGD